MAVSQYSTCPHITIVGDYTKEDIIKKQELNRCDSCLIPGPYLWVCLHRDCLYVGCGEASVDHSSKHFKEKPDHSLTLNLTTLRVWCYLCECEVFLENNDPPLPGMITGPMRHISSSKVYVADPDTDDEEDDDGQNLKPRGLTGLQNLGNTCYMNSAIQALSNCPQLTNFFLDCTSSVRSDKKPNLAKSYMKLVKEMWHKKRPSYIVPSSVAYGIKMVFPVFRGYGQQDAQEFLRCVMDQLHEELKEPTFEVDSNVSSDCNDDYDSCQGEGPFGRLEDSSQSEAEFETCDSGLSSEKSSCNDESPEARDFVVAEEDVKGIPSGVDYNGASLQQVQLSLNFQPTSDQRDQQENNREGNETASVSQQVSTPEEKRSLGAGDWDRETPSTETAEGHFFQEKKPPPISQRSNRSSEQRRQSNQGIYLGKLQTGAGTRSHGQYGQRERLSPPPQGYSYGSKPPGKRKKSVIYRSVISDIFDGKILSSVQCLTCDTVSTTKETFQDLSLPIPGRDHIYMLHSSLSNQQKGVVACTDAYNSKGWFNWLFGWVLSWFWGPTVSLQDCLAAFFSADELKGDNMYSCEKCKKLRNGIKYSKVLQLPEVLCIHLKRFRHEVMFSSKISSFVSFPLEGLDMSPFLHKNCPRETTTYDLVAAICHHGTASCGHYTAYALNYLNDQWYEFDDQYVTAVDPQVVKNCEAYVLFYRKSSEEIVKKRQRAVELMERSKNEPGLLHFYISKQWVNKFNTFANPGPISNSNFLCPHGGVHPSKASFVEELCTVLSQSVWEYLHDTFGGGPACTHLYVCPCCLADQENLDRRRTQEHDTFVTLNKEFQSLESPTVVYAISMSWFKQWESFVRAKESEPPGPIHNSPICVMRNNQPTLKAGSDYGSLSEEMWRFLLSTYGGGPEIILQQNILTMPTAAAPVVSRSVGSGSMTGVYSSPSLSTKVTISSQVAYTGSSPSLNTPLATVRLSGKRKTISNVSLVTQDGVDTETEKVEETENV
ncbi:ubiquitin carboxyl-terminal hydrolase 20-like isoform X2 [Limulus polyphemus]|uniref:ubiquitinyl hydrolase 1 n=1 Tax=Limulus polyphemus TaxID=6850 RepID=A0ABM1B681_LIMPO|nr:ubiquitin carboxyl-terminal hydrolase 20-like isoform X2 [Limulus polyphemus]